MKLISLAGVREKADRRTSHLDESARPHLFPLFSFFKKIFLRVLSECYLWASGEKERDGRGWKGNLHFSGQLWFEFHLKRFGEKHECACWVIQWQKMKMFLNRASLKFLLALSRKVNDMYFYFLSRLFTGPFMCLFTCGDILQVK